ncbi:GNAT family N-acetyltransferase [Pseudohaliea sp.]|uniref:GNAT family N-acetyltransferase n=1 Tax=Pseudohaliea sp. TaxID=2740289 RepID=UPI0032F04F9B
MATGDETGDRWEALPFDALGVHRLYDILALRQAVFVVEQDCPYLDCDGLDAAAWHLFCHRRATLLAYQRCLPPGTPYRESSIGRIIVPEAGRGLGLGRELVRRGIAFNRERWPGHAIRIGAQARLTAFYESLGFTVDGDSYDEDGIEHIHMTLPAGA